MSKLANVTGEGVIRVFFRGGFCSVADPGSHGGIKVFFTCRVAGVVVPIEAATASDDTELIRPVVGC